MKYRQKVDSFLYSIFQELELVGKYSMPKIRATQNTDILNLLTFNYAKTCLSPKQYYLCFYIDDYQFERLWNEPQKYLPLLASFKGLIGTDFSMYRDFPTILNIYNCWRNKVLMAYWQSLGLEVIPNVSWSDESSYDWCFDGLPENSVLAVSTNGILKDKTAKALFLAGYREMKTRLKPIKVVVVGSLPKELENDPDIINFEGYTSLFGKEDKQLCFKGVTNKLWEAEAVHT